MSKNTIYKLFLIRPDTSVDIHRCTICKEELLHVDENFFACTCICLQ